MIINAMNFDWLSNNMYKNYNKCVAIMFISHYQ